MLPQIPSVGETVTAWAGAADYCKIFDEQMNSLYLLAFLLTANEAKAEQCFLGGFEHCTRESRVTTTVPLYRARRAIVGCAIEMIRPAPEQELSRNLVINPSATSGTSDPFAAIVTLGEFERFVFVMSILEGQPDEDCRSLLRCSRQQFVTARKLALRLLATINPVYEHDQDEMHIWRGLLN
jgi:hypothetical protein